ncbi:hypothetical protein B0H14DRAFT_2749119 [Mycena olivaceomarginata]|nr:hypothetical protein B0H14DRAFT_2749119 [Mycena olivaceomarginata]
MVKAFSIFITLLAAGLSVSRPITLGDLESAIAAGKDVTITDTPVAAPTGTAAIAINKSISSAAAAASVAAAAAQASDIAANTTPGEAFVDPSDEGEEAFLQTKIELEENSGEDDAAEKDQEALTEFNESFGGGSG